MRRQALYIYSAPHCTIVDPRWPCPHCSGRLFCSRPLLFGGLRRLATVQLPQPRQPAGGGDANRGNAGCGSAAAAGGAAGGRRSAGGMATELHNRETDVVELTMLFTQKKNRKPKRSFSLQWKAVTLQAAAPYVRWATWVVIGISLNSRVKCRTTCLSPHMVIPKRLTAAASRFRYRVRWQSITGHFGTSVESRFRRPYEPNSVQCSNQRRTAFVSMSRILMNDARCH